MIEQIKDQFFSVLVEVFVFFFLLICCLGQCMCGGGGHRFVCVSLFINLSFSLSFHLHVDSRQLFVGLHFSVEWFCGRHERRMDEPESSFH